MTHVARFVIAAPHSGAGKTTVTAVLIAALKARGLTVQPFKVGPDYIDPTHLSAVAECRARNLDGFFLEEPEMLEIFRRAAETADIAVLEGVMGLFDGKDPLGKIGSTAQVAKRLKAPVLLVIDARAMAGSVAAVAKGFHRHDPELEIAGVIANKVGSERHADILVEALSTVGIPFLGYLMRQEGLELPLGVELVDLPPYSPELQPAERLWRLTDEPLVNKNFDSLDQLQQCLSERCAFLLTQPELLSGETFYHWWHRL